ncbi:MAG: DinB family protein, partial [Chitinophagaceae bacterium]
SEQQLASLRCEGDNQATTANAEQLLQAFVQGVTEALIKLAQTDSQTLTHERSVGRAKLPSTVAGLLFHAAEHTMRHVGQLITTIRILKAQHNQLH